MDTKLTRRIEDVGAIVIAPEKSRLPLLESYIKKYHQQCWELLEIDRAVRSKRNWKNSELQLIRSYQAWLERHDRAWALASQFAALERSDNWEELSDLTGLSRETCRQTVQAMARGGGNKI